MFPLLSSNHKPFREFLHWLNNSLSSNNLNPSHSLLLHSSGGSKPRSINLSKCLLRMPSIPEGRLGNMPCGLCHTRCSVNQKQRGHSFMRFKDDGESLNVGGMGRGKEKDLYILSQSVFKIYSLSV